MSHPNVTPERILDLSKSIDTNLRASLDEINAINLRSQMLSLNSRIEAARAGAAGSGFAVVAQQMKSLAEETRKAADRLVSEVQRDIGELSQISRQLSTEVRGQRLSDLALNNIDLIDRNLYERSCDVRWWATDPSLTQACEEPADVQRVRFASKRMGVILNAYTVYFDLVLCTPDGRVIANGRPGLYRSAGASVSGSEWFKAALATRSGEEFGFQTVHPSALVSDERILAYSCAVRKGGESQSQVVGVLGILFRWDALALTVVRNTPLLDDEKAMTRVVIVDATGLVLADTGDGMLRDRLSFTDARQIFKRTKGYVVTDHAGIPTMVAHAYSPGYETYSTGWHSLILQRFR
ncbi:MAG: methyl-accepting chemotaxis protein [Gammaproteobacteria bacterium]|nr:methyl-accepting chemotaxis protein [Gammaproteobacteria bacterium]